MTYRKLNIATKVYADNSILIRTETDNEYYERVVDMENQAIREQLIKAGWSPPRRDKKAHVSIVK